MSKLKDFRADPEDHYIEFVWGINPWDKKKGFARLNQRALEKMSIKDRTRLLNLLQKAQRGA